MTKKEILEGALKHIESERVYYICQAISISGKGWGILHNELIDHFSNPNNIPKRYRGAYWRGDAVNGLWHWKGKRMRTSYLKHLISKL